MKSKVGTTIIIVLLLIGIAGMFYFNWTLFNPSNSETAISFDDDDETPVSKKGQTQTPTAKATDTPEAPKILYENDFSDKKALEDFAAPVDTGDNNAPSKWAITNGALLQSSNIFGGTSAANGGSPAGKTYFGTYLLLEKEKFSDFEMEATLKAADDDGMGFVIRHDGSRYYRLLAVKDSKNGGPFLMLDKHTLKNQRPSFEGLKTTNWEFDQNKEYTFRIQAKENTIKVWINGTLQLEASDDSDNYIEKGRVGFYSYGMLGLTIDNFKIAEIGGLGSSDGGTTKTTKSSTAEKTVKNASQKISGSVLSTKGNTVTIVDDATSKRQTVQIIDATVIVKGGSDGDALEFSDIKKNDKIDVFGDTFVANDEAIFIATKIIIAKK